MKNCKNILLMTTALTLITGNLLGAAQNFTQSDKTRLDALDTLIPQYKALMKQKFDAASVAQQSGNEKRATEFSQESEQLHGELDSLMWEREALIDKIRAQNYLQTNQYNKR